MDNTTVGGAKEQKKCDVEPKWKEPRMGGAKKTGGGAKCGRSQNGQWLVNQKAGGLMKGLKKRKGKLSRSELTSKNRRWTEVQLERL